MERRLPGLCMAILVLATACGKNAPERAEYKLLEIPRQILTTHKQALKTSSFQLDHGSSAEMARGYLTRQSLENMPTHFLENVTELYEEYAAEPGDGYHDYEELTAWLERFSAEHADIVSLQSAGQSVEGRELWYVKISDQVSQDENEPKLLYIANMHGNETAGRELMLYLIEDLVTRYKDNEATITNLINHSQIFIMPSMNPDGFEDGRRWNSRNVDLNRDFPDFSSDPELRLESRQPETQAIIKLHQEHHFHLAINFHGGAVCFNLPWDTVANQNPTEKFGDDLIISTYGQQYARSNPVMYASGRFPDGMTYGYEWYEVDGGMQDWANYYAKSIHATVELSNRKYPRASQLEDIWLENRTSMVEFLQNGLNGVHLELQGSYGETVGSTAIEIDSSLRPLSYGQYKLTRLSLPGKQRVTISAAGYVPQELELEARPFDGTFHKVRLQPEEE